MLFLSATIDKTLPYISQKTRAFKGLARSAETINSASLRINKGRATAYNVVADTVGRVDSG